MFTDKNSSVFYCATHALFLIIGTILRAKIIKFKGVICSRSSHWPPSKLKIDSTVNFQLTVCSDNATRLSLETDAKLGKSKDDFSQCASIVN